MEEGKVRGELQLLEVEKWRGRFYELLEENKKMKEEVKGLKDRVKENVRVRMRKRASLRECMKDGRCCKRLTKSRE